MSQALVVTGRTTTIQPYGHGFVKRARRRASLYLVLDHSGSMAEPCGSSTKMEAVRQASLTLLEHRRRAFSQDFVGVIGFGTSARVLAPLVPVSTGYPILNEAVSKLLPGGTTNLDGALGLLVDRMRTLPLFVIRKAIVLSDGVPDRRDNLPGLIAEAKSERIYISTVAFGNPGNCDTALLQWMATQTGGTYFEASDLSSLTTAMHGASMVGDAA